MHITFHVTDESFKENLATLRQATIKNFRTPHKLAPKFLDIVIDGRAITATTAHVRLDGWFAYSDDGGERRVELDRVSKVVAYY